MEAQIKTSSRHRSGTIIDSIKFSYVDQAGQLLDLGEVLEENKIWSVDSFNEILCDFLSFIFKQQTLLYSFAMQFVLSTSEFLKEVSGTFALYGRDNHNIITSLKFVTHVKSYGPFGQAKGTTFTIPVQKNSSIVGFFGRSGIYLDALAVYVHHL